MNPLHLELLANDRRAELRRYAPTFGFGPTVSTSRSPDPRIPRRGPLHSFSRLGLLVRGAFA